MKPNNNVVSVGFISLGCAKNLVDSQLMAGVLLSENIKLARSPEEADIVIVNTCAFIEEARTESFEMIESACNLKETGPCRAVLVTGCLPQRYRGNLKVKLPKVDAFKGLDELEEAGALIRRLAEGKRGIFDVSPKSVKIYEPKVPGINFAGGPFAYLKVAEGCNHRCSFCSIPSIRGAYRSRTISQIVSEAGKLLINGVKELNLVSQDVTSYGRDLKYETDLPKLIEALGQLDGNFWIRLLYGHPAMISDRLLRVMAEIPKVCNYFDLPIQHSHPDILRAMRRSDTILHVEKIADRIRNVMPDAALRTTCLLGFPGET
jgi:ribosomal protein S12 methylthiotransferase